MLRQTRISIDRTLAKICLHQSVGFSKYTSRKNIRNINYLLRHRLIIQEPMQYHNKIYFTASTNGFLYNSKRQSEISKASSHSIGRFSVDLFMIFISLGIYAIACALLRSPSYDLISGVLLLLSMFCSSNIVFKNLGFQFRNIKKHNPKLHKLYSGFDILVGIISCLFAILIFWIKLLAPFI